MAPIRLVVLAILVAMAALVPWLMRLLILALAPLGVTIVLAGCGAPARQRRCLALLALAAACFCWHIHHQFVDQGSYFGDVQNADWQESLQHSVMRGVGWVPHSYRFLSHCVVAWLQWLTDSFEFACAAYRIIFGAVMFATLIRYALLYLRPAFAGGVVVALVLVYPVTIASYAGQFVDPASHLSFVACLFFLARPYEPGLAPTLVAGVLAKESVAVMALCRAFYGEPRRALALAALYGAVALAVVVAVRLYANAGILAYEGISGVSLDHVVVNLRRYDEWGPQYLGTLGVLAPGAWLGWRLMDRPFRWTCITLTIALLVSSAFFSWLVEVRNLVPALMMLAVVNMRYAQHRFDQAGGVA